MGLLDILLQGTRFDQKNTLDNRMQGAGVAPQAQPQPQPQLPTGNDPESMIRRLRMQRQMEKQAEAAQYMQAMGGQVLPR